MEHIYKTTSLSRNMTLSPDIAGILMGGYVTLDGMATRPLILFEVNDLTLAHICVGNGLSSCEVEVLAARLWYNSLQ